jgi:putative heme-binding domain-containing protein
MLTGFKTAITGRNLGAPAGWDDIERKLDSSANKQVRMLARSLSLAFGNKAAIQAAHAIVANRTGDVEERRAALNGLLEIKDPELPGTLRAMLDEREFRGTAIRAMAIYNDAETPAAILNAYAALSPAEQRDALNTLASRPDSAAKLMVAITENRIPSKDLSANIVRQLRALNQPGINAQLEKLWGVARETSADKLAAERRLRGLVENRNLPPPNAARGRQLFSQSCGQCHTLFGEGGKVGPDLTGSNRSDLDYLLHNILDPSAEVPNQYRPTIFDLKDDRTIVGIVALEDADTISVVTPNETVRIRRNEVARQNLSELSMMPDGLLTQLSDDQVRDLIAYLRSPFAPSLK